MFKWKRNHEGNKFEYKLVLEDDDDEVVGSIIVTEDINSDITVEAECEEIGYKDKQEHIDMNILKSTVCNMKKFIKEELEKIEALR